MTKLIALRDVVERTTGTRNPTTTPIESFVYVDVAAVDNFEKAILGARRVLGAEAPSRARKLIRAGDVLVSTVRPNLNAVALVPAALDGQIASTGFCILRATRYVLPDYLFFYVRSRGFIDGLTQLVAGAMYPAVSDSQVLAQQLPLPSIDAQQRVVDLLLRAEGIVRLRREAQKKAQQIIPALFLDMFGDPAVNPNGWPVLPLGDVAEVISGVTKGRQINAAEIIERPYLRVANVKDGYLDLQEIKTISIRPAEMPRLRVEPGDLLMTEGGDPDKLGRAALWRGEIAECVHQNHVFKVRSDRTRLAPTYLRALAGSLYGKGYFLRVAKRTTGIASINKTQLSAFPVVVPPLDLQLAFERHVDAAEAIMQAQEAALLRVEATFRALLARTFSSNPANAEAEPETAVA